MRTFSPVLLLLCLGTACQGVQAPVRGEVRVHRYAGPPYDQVNSYWFETPEGVVIVDAQRLTHQARYLAEEIRATTTKPVRAILITHHHPDHTGGLPVLRAAFGAAVPILTSAFTREDLATDASGLLAARRRFFGQDFPRPQDVPVPDRAVQDGEQLTLAGVMVRARVLEHVDSPASVVWELPGHGLVFLGDFAPDRKTPALRGGTSTTYLAALEAMERELERYTLGYPGHGEPGAPVALLRATRAYIEALRSGVREALEGDCALGADELARVRQGLVSRFDLSFDTLLLPKEHEANIEATARELGAGCVPAPGASRQPPQSTGS